jgi:hypothetical protein
LPKVSQLAGRQSSRLPSIAFCFHLLLPLLLIALLTPVLASTEPDSLEGATKQLGERIAAIPNLHGPFTLEYLLEAPVTSGREKEWKKMFRSELESRRLAVTEQSNAPVMRICVTQTPTQIVLTASVSIGDRQEVRIVAVNRSSVPAANLPVAPVRLERQLIYESPDRILDASSLWNGEERGLAILLLRNAELLALRLDASGAVKQTISIAPASLRLPRDPHAELVPKGPEAEARIPSKICEFTWNGTGDSKCRAAKFAWRETTLLTAPCDSSDWKLEADGNDWSSSDLLQVIPGETAEQGSAAVMSEFPGPVLSINGEQNPNSALIVARNLRTGNYEVYKITLACGD